MVSFKTSWSNTMSEVEFRTTFDSVICGLKSLSAAVDESIDVAGVLSLNEYMLLTNLCKEFGFWNL